MANGGIASSKNALFFAGGVLACAAVAALSLGDHFTPQSDSEGYYTEESEPARLEPLRSATQVESSYDDDTDYDADYDGAEYDEAETEEYQAFSDDDLIDDTSGFDTAPVASAGASDEDSGDDEDAGDGSDGDDY